MATVNIDGDAGGAVAACAAAQGAIDALHGKTVNVDVNVRQSGGGGMAAATRDMEKFGVAADKAQQHVDRLNGSANKAHNSVGKLGDKSGAASDHVDRLGESSRSSSDHVDRLGRSSSDAHDPVSGLGGHARTASGSVGGLGTRANTTSGHLDKLGASASNAHDPLQAIGGLLGNLGGSGGGGGRGGGSGGGSGGGLGGLLGKLGDLPGAAIPSAGALKLVGMAAGYSAVGMGALAGAVAGVGLAGVAEDFAHNSQLMHAGGEAVRGFNREFSAMRGATSAAGAAPMAALATSMKGVGHELASIGAANIAPVLNDAASLGNQATQAMRKLEPAIGPATQGLTALAGSVIGAFGDAGPAVSSFANNVTSHAPQIQAGLSSMINVAAGLGNMAVDTVAAFGSVDQAMQSALNPDGGKSGKSGAQQHREALDRALPGLDEFNGGPGGAIAKNAPQRVAGTAGGHQYANSPMAEAWHQLFGDTSKDAQSPARSGASPGQPSGFDPSKPFSGMLPDGKGGFTSGTESGAAPKADAPKPVRLPHGDFGKGIGAPSLNNVGSPDAAQFKGMTAGQIMEQQRSNAGLAPTGAPTWDGVGGHRPGGMGSGPGTAFHAAPAAMTAPMGGTALPGLMQSMQSQLSAGAGDTGAAAVKHITKAVNQAAPAASAGGASLGGAMSGGMAQGMNSSQSVVDTVTIKHSKHIIDLASAVLGVHSPSEEFDRLGRMTWAGFGRGSDREAPRTFGALSDHLGGALSGAQGQARKFGYDYQDGSPAVVSVRRKTQDPADPSQDPSNPLLSTSSTSMAPPVNHYGMAGMSNIQAHNDRAAQLAQGRADLHAKAMSHLGVTNPATGQKWQDPFKADSNPLAGTSIDPFAKKQSIGQKAGNLWNTLNQTGPQDGGAGLKRLWGSVGESSAQGLTTGMTAHIPKIQAAGAAASVAGVTGYKKKDKQSSPSAMWNGLGGNSMAGLAGGVIGGASGVVGAVNGVGDAMQIAGQQLSDRGLTVGYTYGTNISTGVQTAMKKADYQAQGLPSGIGQAGMLGLAATGLLTAGSGAQSYKTPGNTSGVVTLAPASGSSGNQTLTINHNLIHDDGHITTVATQVTLDMFGRVADVIPLQPGA